MMDHSARSSNGCVGHRHGSDDIGNYDGARCSLGGRGGRRGNFSSCVGVAVLDEYLIFDTSLSFSLPFNKLAKVSSFSLKQAQLSNGQHKWAKTIFILFFAYFFAPLTPSLVPPTNARSANTS